MEGLSKKKNTNSKTTSWARRCGICLGQERGSGLIQQDCVPGASHQARSQTERISSAARSKRMACTAARNVSLACVEVPSKKRIRRRGVWRQRRAGRGVVCGDSYERVRRSVCVEGPADEHGVWDGLRCVTKRGSLGCLLTLDSCDAMPCDASTSLPVSVAWGMADGTLSQLAG